MGDNALGRGLDALIKKPSKSKKEAKTEEKTDKKTETEIKPTFTLSEDKMEEIREEVDKNPRISLWSAKSAACLRYLKKTTPEFSISSEASIILEDAIKDKYPDIWKLFEDL